MQSVQHSQIAAFIWRVADQVLHHVYDKTKYRDIILPMTVLRRFDTVLEPTKDDVLAQQDWARENGITDPDQILRSASGHDFYNTSRFTLKSLLNSSTQLEANFLAYLDTYSPNVRELLQQFEFRAQVPKLAAADRLGPLIQRFVDPGINLGPKPAGNLPGLDNHAMGTVFEELIRRFNEENNAGAGEHFTPRDVVALMADLVLVPVADEVTPSLKLIYDGACGTGGMLSVAEERLHQIAAERGKSVAVTLYGQELNGETWAICQADQLIKAEAAENIAHDSTLSNDRFPDKSFDFMISNPPYGSDWAADLEAMAGSKKKDDIKDPRFVISYAGDPEYRMLPTKADSQLMFLANNLAKMREDTAQGSRIAEIHNGSSLFTGDAGSGESNVRRYVIENDWLEAIIALPLNLFYNTGIATYIWVVSNRKAEHRRGNVQLIDATSRSTPLRKNLGKRNVAISDEQIAGIVAEFLAFEATGTSKIFPNEAFGSWKVTVERPLRLRVNIPDQNPGLANDVWGVVVSTGHDDGWPRTLESAFWDAFKHHAKRQGVKAPATLRKHLRAMLCTPDQTADAVLKSSAHVPYASGTEGDPLHGQFLTPIGNHHFINEYEPDPALRDTEQVGFREPGGIAGFMAREVLPHVPDAWIVPGSEKIGYEINFNRHFYKAQAMRTLAEIEADILALERETDGLLGEILVGAEV